MGLERTADDHLSYHSLFLPTITQHAEQEKIRFPNPSGTREVIFLGQLISFASSLPSLQ